MSASEDLDPAELRRRYDIAVAALTRIAAPKYPFPETHPRYPQMVLMVARDALNAMGLATWEPYQAPGPERSK